MAIIKVSEKVKQELEELKSKGEFKSLDAVIRHYIDSSVEVAGGIFLGTGGETSYPSLGVPPFINIRNVRYFSTHDNYVNTIISDGETIRLYTCLKCGLLTRSRWPKCLRCGTGITPITIQIGFPSSDN